MKKTEVSHPIQMHQRLSNVIQKCFSSFFRSEAVFDLLFISEVVP
jgi:hypothetical protein